MPSAMALVAMFVIVVMAAMARVIVAQALSCDQILGKSACGVEPGVVCGRKKVLEGRKHMLAELRLPYAGETAVSAKALHKPLNRRIRQDL